MMEFNIEYNHLFALPTKKPKYYNVEIKKGNEDFEVDDWPKISDCDGSMLMFGDGKQYLPIYLPPENKGYALVYNLIFFKYSIIYEIYLSNGTYLFLH